MLDRIFDEIVTDEVNYSEVWTPKQRELRGVIDEFLERFASGEDYSIQSRKELTSKIDNCINELLYMEQKIYFKEGAKFISGLQKELN